MTRPRVLITRPEADAAPLAAILNGHGVDVVLAPMMTVVPVSGPPLDWSGVQAVALTSVNGVRALASRDPRRDLPVFAVGDGTARMARELGFRSVVSADGDTVALAALIIARLDPAMGAVRHVAGATVAGDLCGRLKAAGFACARDTLYEAQPLEGLPAEVVRRIGAGEIAAVLLFSPRTARLLVARLEAAGLAPACPGIAAVCLSDRVATAAARLPWRRIVVAARPDQESQIAAVLGLLSGVEPW